MSTNSCILGLLNESFSLVYLVKTQIHVMPITTFHAKPENTF